MKRIATPSTIGTRDGRLQNSYLRANPASNSQTQGSIFNLATRIFGPRLDALRLAQSSYQNSGTPVLSLFKRCRPTAIARAVIPIVVLAFDAERFRISICERPVFKGLKNVPFHAQSDAARSIAFVVLAFWILATVAHPFPDQIQPVGANRESSRFSPFRRATFDAAEYAPCRTRIKNHRVAAVAARNRDFRDDARLRCAFAGAIIAASIVPTEKLFHRIGADRAEWHGFKYAATCLQMKWEAST